MAARQISLFCASSWPSPNEKESWMEICRAVIEILANEIAFINSMGFAND